MRLADVMNIETNEKLKDSIKAASRINMTPQEMREQRVSFVYGSVKNSTGLTKEKIRDVIENQRGRILG